MVKDDGKREKARRQECLRYWSNGGRAADPPLR
jgi:hypothetical protein